MRLELPQLTLPGRSTTTRWDIQGLRAFAVLVVIGNHLANWPRGGFIGVDAFFVISGFVITGTLTRESERTGRISWLGFYQRRVKRILPAAVLTLVVTVVVSHFVFVAERARSIATDSLWALFFGANWHFRAIGTDYFTADAPKSPLQHFWSLSIEEQFYFVWPWLMLALLLAFGRRRRQAAHWAAFGVITALTIASFAWAIHETSNDLNGAYFSTFSRAWELGVGAMLAMAAPALYRMHRVARPPLAWVGMAGLVVSLFAIQDGPGFPAPKGALPIIATALIIAAGTYADGTQQRLFWPITSRGAAYLGDISYSLYLWHFPAIILGEAMVGSGVAEKVWIGFAIAALSVSSYHLVEDPIRRSRLFAHAGPFKDGGWIPAETRRGARYAGVFGVVCLAVLMGAAAIRPATPPRVIVLPATPLATQAASPSHGIKLGPVESRLQSQIRSGVEASSWGQLSPSFSSVLAQGAPADLHSCGQRDTIDLAQCSWGSTAPKHKVVVVGDSMAVMYMTALRRIYSAMPGWRIYEAGAFGCPFVDIATKTTDSSVQARCEHHQRNALAAVKSLRPDVLIVSNTAAPYTALGSVAPMTEAEWSQHLAGEIAAAKHYVGRTIILAPPPADKDPNACYTPRSTPADCVGTITKTWSMRASTEATLAESDGATWVDATPWFCYQDFCPMSVGTHVVKFDQTHIAPGYGEFIAPAMKEALVERKVLR